MAGELLSPVDNEYLLASSLTDSECTSPQFGRFPACTTLSLHQSRRKLLVLSSSITLSKRPIFASHSFMPSSDVPAVATRSQHRKDGVHQDQDLVSWWYSDDIVDI
jgi:hypothetical protein